jgi:hypothetical protein
VAIAGPGRARSWSSTKRATSCSRWGRAHPLGAWSFQTGDDASLCGGGEACLAIGWDDVLGTFDAMGGTAGHPIWVTDGDTTRRPSSDATWPSPDESGRLQCDGESRRTPVA